MPEPNSPRLAVSSFTMGLRGRTFHFFIGHYFKVPLPVVSGSRTHADEWSVLLAAVRG
jgi:hypothetical protein